jgi:energy-coupling factor transporter transmembrane protein EcfT
MPAVFFLLLGMPNWLPSGINSFLYLCGMLTLASLFSATTSIAEAAEALARLGVKREKAIAFPLALQSAKTFGNKLQSVRRAQAARGGGGVFPVLLPLFHSVFRRARTLANSLESRGFSAE